jgi:hypothetical protein
MSKSRLVYYHFSLALLLSIPACAQEQSWIRLLDGYALKRSVTVDAYAGTIEKAGGLSIEFETGATSGFWADPKRKKTYSWYQEQMLNGRQVRVALIKPGVTTPFEPKSSPRQKPGGILLVTIVLNTANRDAANFSAKVQNSKDVADVLLMVATFDPSKI